MKKKIEQTKDALYVAQSKIKSSPYYETVKRFLETGLLFILIFFIIFFSPLSHAAKCFLAALWFMIGVFNLGRLLVAFWWTDPEEADQETK